MKPKTTKKAPTKRVARKTTTKRPTSKSKSLLSSAPKFSRRQLGILAGVFVAFGLFIIFLTRAGTIALASVEAEAMTPPAGGVVINDSTASGTKALKFTTNGTASSSFTLSSESDSITVRAKGVSCSGSPQMVVKVNGATIQTASVNSTGWADYPVAAKLPASTTPHTLSVSFTNDYSYTHKNYRKNCSRDLIVDKVAVTGTATDPAPVPPPPPPPPAPEPVPPVTSGSILWNGDMEEGTMADWYAPEAGPIGNYGGGEYNSGSGTSGASRDVAHTGSFSSKMSLDDGIGGVRLFRWKELRENRTTVQSTWMYIPKNYTLNYPDLNSGRYWSLFQFKARDASHNDPFWYVNAYNRSDGSLGAKLAWGYQSRLEGPHQGEVGWRNYGDMSLPVGRWFKIEAKLTQSKDFDGAISVTIDDQSLANVTNVRTGWPNCTYNSWCVDQGWSVNNYSDGLTPVPAIIYSDDAAIMRL